MLHPHPSRATVPAPTRDDAAAVVEAIGLAGASGLVVFEELGTAPASAFDRELSRIQNGPALVLLDLRGLECLDAAGMHVLRRAHQRAERAGARFVVECGPEVRWFLELVGVTCRLELVAEAEAEADLAWTHQYAAA